MPLSMIATFTPPPVAPPQAHSRSIWRSAAALISLPRASSRNGSDHAGMSGSVTQRLRLDRAPAATGVRGNNLEDVADDAQLAVGEVAHSRHSIDELPERRLGVGVQLHGRGSDEVVDLVVRDVVADL